MVLTVETTCSSSIMAPDPRVLKAFKSMKAIGISENKAKPVLKKLLKLYEKNWELIEEENYRALADAIFEEEDAKVHLPFFVKCGLVCDVCLLFSCPLSSNFLSYVLIQSIRFPNRRKLKLLMYATFFSCFHCVYILVSVLIPVIFFC